MTRTTATTLFAATLGFLCWLPAAAADCERPSEREVMAAEMQRYQAQMDDDFAAMDRLIGADLVYIHSSSVVDDKRAYIDSMRSGDVKYHRMRMLDSKVRIFHCLALMTGTASFDVTVKGQDLTVDLRFTEAWVKREGKLEFVSWQATRIPPRQ
jgi:hypothetical protein